MTLQVVLVVKNLPANAGYIKRDMGVFPGWEDSLEEEIILYYSVLCGESHGQRSLADYGL